MKALFVGYPKCSTCKRASEFLDKEKIAYKHRDIKEDRPTYQEIKKWHELSSLNIKKFFNTSGQVYRSLKLKDKLEKMSLEEKYELLASDGMLVKRPIFIKDGKLIIGFKEEKWQEFLK